MLSEFVADWEQELKTISALLFENGWAEANGGNISIHLNKPLSFQADSIALEKSYPELENESFAITVSGSRMRDIARDLNSNICVVKIINNGTAYIVNPADAFPSSELPAHLAVHSKLAQYHSVNRVFLHTHPPHLIALSQKLKPPQLIETLVRMFPEAALMLYNNIQVLPYIASGSQKLAELTAQAIGNAHGVLWSGHGMCATGKDISSAFDVVDVAEKAARIALLLGDGLMTAGLSQEQLDDIIEAKPK